MFPTTGCFYCRTQGEHDTSPHLFATWVRDTLEVAYDHLRESLHRTAALRKRLYDIKEVNKKFPVGSWVLRYYLPPPPPPRQLNTNWDIHGLDLIRSFDRPHGRHPEGHPEGIQNVRAPRTSHGTTAFLQLNHSALVQWPSDRVLMLAT